jgi:hypothetical protein
MPRLQRSHDRGEWGWKRLVLQMAHVQAEIKKDSHVEAWTIATHVRGQARINAMT